MPKANLEAKLEQAIFHFQKMKASKEDKLAFDSSFAAYLAALKAVVYYIENWMVDNGKVNKIKFFERLKLWEDKLPDDQREKWLCISELRNKDNHVEPIIPEPKEAGYFPTGYFPKNYFPRGWWPIFKNFTITDPKSNKTYDIFDACQSGIDVVRKLIEEYTTL